MHYVFGQRARMLCSRGNVVRSLCAFLFEKSSALVCPFSRENWGQSSAPHVSGPAIAEAVRRLISCGLQMELADEFERGINGCFFNMCSSAILHPCVLALRHHYPCAFCILASFRVRSSKEAWQDRSPREHKSVLCVLGIENTCMTCSSVAHLLTS